MPSHLDDQLLAEPGQAQSLSVGRSASSGSARVMIVSEPDGANAGSIEKMQHLHLPHQRVGALERNQHTRRALELDVCGGPNQPEPPIRTIRGGKRRFDHAAGLDGGKRPSLLGRGVHGHDLKVLVSSLEARQVQLEARQSGQKIAALSGHVLKGVGVAVTGEAGRDKLLGSRKQFGVTQATSPRPEMK
jgi:hypothetical protein